jgi:hypothetical protein
MSLPEVLDRGAVNSTPESRPYVITRPRGRVTTRRGSDRGVPWNLGLRCAALRRRDQCAMRAGVHIEHLSHITTIRARCVIRRSYLGSRGSLPAASLRWGPEALDAMGKIQKHFGLGMQ